jgi:TPR repeat protein
MTANNENFFTEFNNPVFGRILADAQTAEIDAGEEESYKLYAEAAALGSSTACQKVGQMHVLGEGCTLDRQKALDYFRRGVQLGNGSCYYDLFELFMNSDTYSDEDFKTALKCMDKYLESDHFKNEIETPFGGIDFALEGYCQSMLRDVNFNRASEIPANHMAALSKYKARILKSKQDMADGSPTGLADLWLDQIAAIRKFVRDPVS